MLFQTFELTFQLYRKVEPHLSQNLQNLNSSENSKGIVCAQLRPFRRRIEKFQQQPISTVIVDVDVYNIFRKSDFMAAL